MCNTLNIKALELYCNIKKWNIELDTLIKNSTCDYSLDNPNVAAKQLSDAVLEMNANFKNVLKGKFEKPWETIKRYKTTLNELDKTYKQTLLGNEKSKSGMYIG